MTAPDILEIKTGSDGKTYRRKEDFGDKVKAHTRYETSDGLRVPGVTTVIGVLNKPYLVGWANRLGLDGIDNRKWTDEAALIGNCAHELIVRDLDGREPALADYSANQIERAHYGLREFRRWREETGFEPILVEKPLVSDLHRFGGTEDSYGVIRGKPGLVDFKTSANVYSEHKTQASALVELLKEHGYAVKWVRILKIGRTPDEGFAEHRVTPAEQRKRWELFQHCLAIYYLNKGLR